MAGWDAATSTGTTLAEKSGYPHAGMTLGGNAVLAETPQLLTLDGVNSYAAADGPVVDETNSFTASALVRVDSAKFVGKADGHTVTVAKQRLGEDVSWALKLVKLADDVDGDNKPECQWRFERATVDGSGNKTSAVQVSSTSVAVLDELVHVTGVYDAPTSSPKAMRPGTAGSICSSARTNKWTRSRSPTSRTPSRGPESSRSGGVTATAHQAPTCPARSRSCGSGPGPWKAARSPSGSSAKPRRTLASRPLRAYAAARIARFRAWAEHPDQRTGRCRVGR